MKPKTPLSVPALRAALAPDYDQAMRAGCAMYSMPLPVGEFQFAPPRLWKFDYCWKDTKIALEIEGGAFTQGRHTRGAGFVADMEKYNRAVILGYRVIRCTPAQVNSGEAFSLLAELMGLEPIEGLR